jgi:hypothetical protein
VVPSRWQISSSFFLNLNSCPTGEPIRGEPQVLMGSPLSFSSTLQSPDGVKKVILTCINSILTGEMAPPRSWLGGLICFKFLIKKDTVLDISGYSPVCLLDTVFKILSAIVTDRLYSLEERYCLHVQCRTPRRRDSAGCTPRSDRCRVCTGQFRKLMRKEPLFCCYLDFANAFNSVDHVALRR